MAALADAVACCVPLAPAESGLPPGDSCLNDEQMLDLWLDTVQVLTKLCTEECQPLRDSAIGVLHRCDRRGLG